MAKRSTPKKQQAGSSTSSRYKTYQNKARKRLEEMAKGFTHSLKKGEALEAKKKATKASAKVTKIKA